MGRPASENPRNQVIHFRITEDDSVILDAMAAIQRVTGNEIAYQVLLEALELAQRDELVQEQLALHAKFDERKAGTGTVTQIGKSKKPSPSDGR